MNWTVYIIEVSDGSYYTGITNNLDKRMKTHSAGKGSKYVKSRLPIISILYCENHNNRSEASKREYVIKKMTRKQKEELFTKEE